MFGINKIGTSGSIFILTLLIIAGIAVLGYFGINVQRDVVGNPTVQSNFSYVWGQLSFVWDNYLRDMAVGLWNWIITNVTNLPVGSGNGILAPMVGDNPAPEMNYKPPVDLNQYRIQ